VREALQRSGARPWQLALVAELFAAALLEPPADAAVQAADPS
jgi:hypothetical protein